LKPFPLFHFPHTHFFFQIHTIFSFFFFLFICLLLFVVLFCCFLFASLSDLYQSSNSTFIQCGDFSNFLKIRESEETLVVLYRVNFLDFTLLFAARARPYIARERKKEKEKPPTHTQYHSSIIHLQKFFSIKPFFFSLKVIIVNRVCNKRNIHTFCHPSVTVNIQREKEKGRWTKREHQDIFSFPLFLFLCFILDRFCSGIPPWPRLFFFKW
jgi:hypothetical protein